MSQRHTAGKLVWLVTGLAAGLSIAYFWPHEPVDAATSDRGEKFGMATCPVSFIDGTEGVFVLDYLTGQLQGAMVNPRTGKFTISYARKVAADFNVDPQAEPHYVMVSGNRGQNVATGGATPAAGIIYVGELSSGKIIAYAFPYQETQRPVPTPIPMTPTDMFQFRQPVIRD